MHTTPKALELVFNGPVLLVEDNLVIAMDTEAMLERLGATSVTICMSVGQAIKAMESDLFSFAVLDAKLGGETCLPVAHACAAKGIPFVFATGYGVLPELQGDYPNVPMVMKPYDQNMIADGARERLSSWQTGR